MRQLCKGNVAIVKAAILAGCRRYYGYPLPPPARSPKRQLCICHRSAELSCRRKAKSPPSTWCTASCDRGPRHDRILSPRPQLDAGAFPTSRARAPCVIVDVVRAGPGLGNIAPEQSDYFCLVKGGGHGNYRNIVLAPASVQEMADLTFLRSISLTAIQPRLIMADGFIGQMMEPVELTTKKLACPKNPGPLKEPQEYAATTSPVRST